MNSFPAVPLDVYIYFDYHDTPIINCQYRNIVVRCKYSKCRNDFYFLSIEQNFIFEWNNSYSIFERSIIILSDTKMRTWSWSANSIEPSETAMLSILVAKANHFRIQQENACSYIFRLNYLLTSFKSKYYISIQYLDFFNLKATSKGIPLQRVSNQKYNHLGHVGYTKDFIYKPFLSLPVIFFPESNSL